MEFYADTQLRMSAADIQRHVRIASLPEWCASIERVLDYENDRGRVLGVWGEMPLRRELIGEGVRFSMPASPCALQWTVSSPHGNGHALVHATIIDRQPSEELRETIEHFVSDWRAGLEDWPLRRAAEGGKPCINCGESFGGFG